MAQQRLTVDLGNVAGIAARLEAVAARLPQGSQTAARRGSPAPASVGNVDLSGLIELVTRLEACERHLAASSVARARHVEVTTSLGGQDHTQLEQCPRSVQIRETEALDSTEKSAESLAQKPQPLVASSVELEEAPAVDVPKAEPPVAARSVKIHPDEEDQTDEHEEAATYEQHRASLNPILTRQMTLAKSAGVFQNQPSESTADFHN
uniref:Uncharacterized protein n=1 Tax=Noctiluca scintillans TaxID=2966 RepID=A0A7S1ACB0_NOCSC